MPKLNIAGTTLVDVPKSMVFLDDKGKGHIYPSLTAKNHISSHYGIPSISLKDKKGYTVAVGKSVYTDSSNSNIVNMVKKAKTMVKKATNAVNTAGKKMRGRPRKNPSAPVAAAPKARRARRSKEEVAMDKQIKADEKAFKKAERDFLRAKKQEEKAIAKAEKKKAR